MLARRGCPTALPDNIADCEALLAMLKERASPYNPSALIDALEHSLLPTLREAHRTGAGVVLVRQLLAGVAVSGVGHGR